MAPDTQSRFDRCIVIINPVSTHAVPVKRRIAQLQKLFPTERFYSLETSPEGRAANQQLLAKHADLLGPTTLLCIAAGDGTVNMFAETLALHPKLSEAARQTVLLPLWGGNANDLACMLNGWPPLSLDTMLKRAAISDVPPLACNFSYADGRQEMRIAVCYVSFGATAHATKEMAKESHRNHPLRRLHASRLAFELVTGYRAFTKAPGFILTEAGERKIMHELMITNGPRYAKVGRTPTKLNGKTFFMHSIESTKPLATALIVIKASMPAYARNLLRRQAEFTIETPTLAQLDGELMQIPAHTHVRIRLAKRPLRMPSTQLA